MTEERALDEPRDGPTWQSALAAGKAAGGRARRPIQRFLTLAWVPLTASFLSLILSVAAIFISSQQPEVLLVCLTRFGSPSYEFAGDAVPLLVSARTASSPVCLFDAPEGFFFAAGTYNFTLTADRVVAGDGLRATFSVTIDPDDITFLDGPGTNRFLAFPIN